MIQWLGGQIQWPVHLVILQPRTNQAVRRTTMDQWEGIKLHGQVFSLELATQEDKYEFVEGSHCWFCKSRASCPVVQKETYDLLESLKENA